MGPIAASLPGLDRGERVGLVGIELGPRHETIDDLNRDRDLELGLVGASPPPGPGVDAEEDPATVVLDRLEPPELEEGPEPVEALEPLPQAVAPDEAVMAVDLGGVGFVEQGPKPDVR